MTNQSSLKEYILNSAREVLHMAKNLRGLNQKRLIFRVLEGEMERLNLPNVRKASDRFNAVIMNDYFHLILRFNGRRVITNCVIIFVDADLHQEFDGRKA